MSAWKLAALDEQQLELVHEAEEALHLDYLLVYSETGGESADPHLADGLRPARLSDSEVECLKGVERKLDAIAVAYERAGA